MEHYQIYHEDIPAFLSECINTPILKRLKLVGMNCGCEYTSFPQFAGLDSYSRYDHSIGVALIIWHFTGNRAQTIAGLLHDVASPVFSHAVDFMHGDYLKQESTEDGTERLIAGSVELQAILREYELTTADVCDYHRYPIADNDSPRLSADRLEYTIGNSINYRICTLEDVQGFYHDLTIGINEEGNDELMFRSTLVAESFAKAALACSRIYVSDADRYAMQILSEILACAIQHRIIKEEDLHSNEPRVINKLLSDDRTASFWNYFCAYRQTKSASQPDTTEYWRKIAAKKRFIDPMVQGQGRISELSPDFADRLKTFLDNSLDYWVCGKC